MRLSKSFVLATAALFLGALAVSGVVEARGGGGGGGRGPSGSGSARRNSAQAKKRREERKKTEQERDRLMRLDHRDSDAARDRSA